MTRRPRPIPAYKARLAQRRDWRAERARLESLVEAHRELAGFYAEQYLRAREAHAEPMRPISFFDRIRAAFTDTTDRLAQDFEPRKGPGDARFF